MTFNGANKRMVSRPSKQSHSVILRITSEQYETTLDADWLNLLLGYTERKIED